MVLDAYERESGQLVSLQKSTLSYSTNVANSRRQEISAAMGIAMADKPLKYLGLPTIVGRSKKELFRSIVDRTRAKLKGWKEKTMSIAARDVMIKSVAQSQLNYDMGVFWVPEGVLEEVQKAMNNFWWGQRGDERKLHWLRREEMAQLKAEGGMGLCDLRGFNIALLAKGLWSLSQRPSSLIGQLLKAKYHRNCDILEADTGFQPSYIWRSLMKTQDFVLQGSRWRVGNGAKIRVWGDRWIPTTRDHIVPSAPKALNVDAHVSDLIDHKTMQWDEGALQECFPEEVCCQVLSIPLSSCVEEDRRVWNGSKKGEYTVRDRYRTWLQSFRFEHHLKQVAEEQVWKSIWKLQIPPKIRYFMWRFTREALASGAKLQGRMKSRDDGCPFCGLREDQQHLFFECQYLTSVWRQSEWRRLFERRQEGPMWEWVKTVFHNTTVEEREGWSVFLWFLWKERNAHLFNNKKMEACEIAEAAKSYLSDYKQCNIKTIRQQITRREGRWSRPPAGKVKINTDASVVPRAGVGMGAVLRDYEVNLLMAATRRAAGDPVTYAEAMAAEFGVATARRNGFRNIVLETDSLSLVQNLEDAKNNWTELGTLCRKIVNDIQCSGDGVWMHVRRGGNKCAHELAKLPVIGENQQVWFDLPPNCIREFLRLDSLESSHNH